MSDKGLLQYEPDSTQFVTPYKQLNVFIERLQALQTQQISMSLGKVDVKVLRDMVLGHVIMNKRQFMGLKN